MQKIKTSESIRISLKNRERMAKLGRFGQSYDDILTVLLDNFINRKSKQNSTI